MKPTLRSTGHAGTCLLLGERLVGAPVTCPDGADIDGPTGGVLKHEIFETYVTSNDELLIVP